MGSRTTGASTLPICISAAAEPTCSPVSTSSSPSTTTLARSLVICSPLLVAAAVKAVVGDHRAGEVDEALKVTGVLHLICRGGEEVGERLQDLLLLGVGLPTRGVGQQRLEKNNPRAVELGSSPLCHGVDAVDFIEEVADLASRHPTAPQLVADLVRTPNEVSGVPLL